MDDEIVVLSENQTCVEMSLRDRLDAISAAYFVTLSPHEHIWTLKQQREMAQYCLWAHQRLSAISQCVRSSLEHSKKPVENEGNV